MRQRRSGGRWSRRITGGNPAFSTTAPPPLPRRDATHLPTTSSQALVLGDKNKDEKIQTGRDQSLPSPSPSFGNKDAPPAGRARKQVLIPRSWVRRGWAGKQAEKLVLISAPSPSASANCPGLARDSCVDSDMSSGTMPQPGLVTPRTAGAACAATIRLLAFISSGLPETLGVFIPLPLSIVPLKKIEARGMMQMCASPPVCRRL